MTDMDVPQQHPNEYIRGATLRFLQKISKDVELLEPLVPTLRANLEHRHSYVRKAAVFAIYTVHREHESLVPDAAELMQTFLAAESDATCKRNAFVFLASVAMNKAAEWLRSVWDGVASMDEGLQMAIIEVARMDCIDDATHKVSETCAYSRVCVLSASRWRIASIYSLHVRAAQLVIACSKI